MWRIQAMAANRRRRSGGADDIAEAIHRMVDAMQPPVATQPRTAIVPVRVPTVKDFLWHKPTEFTGKASPDEADAWLSKCEKIFRVMNCEDEQKLLFATYLLNEDAEYWWTGMQQQMETREESATNGRGFLSMVIACVGRTMGKELLCSRRLLLGKESIV